MTVFHDSLTVIPTQRGNVTIKVMDVESKRDVAATVSFGGVALALCFGRRDGLPVLYVDTPGVDDGPKGPRMRIHLNDSDLFIGQEMPDAEEGDDD